MALRKTVEASGISVVETEFGKIENGTQSVSFLAYIKVISIGGDKQTVNATVSFKGDSLQFKKHYQVPVTTESGSQNFIAQVYAHLKTLPEFSGAIDC